MPPTDHSRSRSIQTPRSVETTAQAPQATPKKTQIAQDDGQRHPRSSPYHTRSWPTRPRSHFQVPPDHIKYPHSGVYLPTPNSLAVNIYHLSKSSPASLLLQRPRSIFTCSLHASRRCSWVTPYIPALRKRPEPEGRSPRAPEAGQGRQSRRVIFFQRDLRGSHYAERIYQTFGSSFVHKHRRLIETVQRQVAVPKRALCRRSSTWTLLVLRAFGKCICIVYWVCGQKRRSLCCHLQSHALLITGIWVNRRSLRISFTSSLAISCALRTNTHFGGIRHCTDERMQTNQSQSCSRK